MLFFLFSLIFSAGFKHREETGIEIIDGSNYVPFQPGFVAGKWCLMHRYEQVVLRGKGYIKVRFECEWWYGWFQNAWPNYHENNENSTLMLVAEGDKYFQQISYETCNNVPEYGYINKYYYLDGEATIQNNERIPKSVYTGSYNMGITDISFDAIDDSQHIIVYDTEDGILNNYTYKFLSRGDYMEGPLIEVRSKQPNTPVYVKVFNWTLNEMSDMERMQQWWRLEYVETDSSTGLHYYKVISVYTGYAMTETDDHKVVQRPYEGSRSQLWSVNRSSSLYYLFKNRNSGLYFDHSLQDGSTYTSERTSNTHYTEEFHVFGIKDYEPPTIPEGFTRYDADDECVTCDNCQFRGGRHVSRTCYWRVHNSDSNLTFHDIPIANSGLYEIRINYAQNTDDVHLLIYVNDKLSEDLPIENTAVVTSVIHDVQCFTDGLHSSYGTILEFNISLPRGSNEIKIKTTSNNLVDIDYLDISSEPYEYYNDENGGGSGNGGVIAAVIIAIAIIVAAGVFAFFFIKKKKERGESFKIFNREIIL